jgi:hypothetical protein
MAEDFVQVAPDSTGAKVRTRSRVIGSNTIEEQYVIIQEEKIVTYQGRAASFKIPGRAVAAQNLAAIHNATGSTVLVRVNRIIVDLLTTVAKAPTVIPPILRVRRFTAVPTNGTTLTKSPRDSALSTTGSTTTLTITGAAIMAQAYAPRLIVVTAVNTLYEPFDTQVFLQGEPDVILRPLEGLVVTAEGATVSTGNPTTDFWTVVIDWDEYTLP